MIQPENEPILKIRNPPENKRYLAFLKTTLRQTSQSGSELNSI